MNSLKKTINFSYNYIKSRKHIFIIFAVIVIILLLIILMIKNTKSISNFDDISDMNKDFESNLENIKNPYINITPENTDNTSNANANIVWLKQDCEFMKNNFPSTFDFDFPIKEDIISRAITLPPNSGIIDCGAHIGDGAVAIAHALKYHKRDDILVYAIDPSKYKCDFMEFIKQKNNLNNLIILNYGLSNVNNTYKSLQQSGNNTGAWDWISINDDNNDSNDGNVVNKFIKLDDLVNNNIIQNNIGIIHFDVEGMEKEAIQGGIETIKKYKPYMTVENNIKSGKDSNGIDNSQNKEYFLQFLPEGYKYAYNKNENNILIAN